MAGAVLYPRLRVPGATLGPDESASGVVLYPRVFTCRMLSRPTRPSPSGTHSRIYQEFQKLKRTARLASS